MRFLHTADWHLGRLYHGLSLLDDQAHLLDQFVALVRQSKPDAVLIAGDVYDRSVPPAEAVRLLDETLTRIVIGERTRVILIAGNHDGPDRLGFGSALLQAAGLTVRGQPQADITPVMQADAHGAVAIYPLPYADPAQLRELADDEALADPMADPIADHHAGFAAQLTQIRAIHAAQRRAARSAVRSVVVAHAFVQGGAESESERPLSVGGTGSVGAELFAGIDYVALGHLHRPQTLGDASIHANIHYSGSLMKYSFNEADQPKSVSLVELDGAGQVSIERIALSPRRDLRILTGDLASLLAAGQSDAGRDDYILARLTDDGALLDAMGKLRSAYPNALGIERVTGHSVQAGAQARVDVRQRDLLHLFDDFHDAMTGAPLDATARDLLAGEIAALRLQQDEREVAA